MIKIRYLVCCALFLLLCGCFVACNETKNEYSIEGSHEFRIGISQEEVDFLQGITGYKNGEKVNVSVDASDVDFGVAGEYEVIYSIDSFTKTEKVYIYGDPQITVSSEEIAYADVFREGGLVKYVSAKDSFGEALTVSVSGEVEKDAFGRVLAKQKFIFSAADACGNSVQIEREMTVVNSYSLNDVSVDLATCDVHFQFDGALQGLYLDEVKVDGKNYFSNNNVFGLEPEYLAELGAGAHTFLFVADAGWAEFTLTVTDNQPANFELPEFTRAYAMADELKIYLPEAQKAGAQKIDFVYGIKKEDGTVCPVESDTAGNYFVPDAAGKYTYTVTAQRGGENAGEKKADIFVRANISVLAETEAGAANILGVAEGTFDSSKVEYSVDHKYSDQLGSVKLTKPGAGAYMSFDIAESLADTTHGYYGITFAVYNDTGLPLEVYVHYSQLVKISADAQWTEVLLTASLEDAALDGLHVFVRGEGEQGDLNGKSVYISNIALIEGWGAETEENLAATYRGNFNDVTFELVLNEDGTAAFGRSDGTAMNGTFKAYENGVLYVRFDGVDIRYSGLGTWSKTAEGNIEITLRDSFTAGEIEYTKAKEGEEVADYSDYAGVYQLQHFYYVLNVDKTFEWGYWTYFNTGTYKIYNDGKIELEITQGTWYKKKIEGVMKNENGLVLSADIGVNGVQDYPRTCSDMTEVADLAAYEGCYYWVNEANANDTMYVNVYSDGTVEWGFGGTAFETQATVYRGGVMRIQTKYTTTGDEWYTVFYTIDNAAKTLTTNDPDRGVMTYERICSLEESNEVTELNDYYGKYEGGGFYFDWSSDKIVWGWGDTVCEGTCKVYKENVMIIKVTWSGDEGKKSRVFVCQLSDEDGIKSITANTGMNDVIVHTKTA